MTDIIIPKVPSSGNDDQRPDWRPQFTEKEAALLGIPARLYRTLCLFALLVTGKHSRLGTARHLWEPSTLEGNAFAAEYVEAGERELIDGLEADVDPVLDEVQDLNESVRAILDEIEEEIAPITSSETGTAYSRAGAVERIAEASATIESDTDQGHHHHRRAHPILRLIGRYAPWLETVGAVAFVTVFLNVSILRPWDDMLGWSFALTVVVGTILGQVWLLRPAAEAHNHSREQVVEGNRAAAEQGFTRRNRFLAAASALILVITGGMVLRGLASLGDDASVPVTVFMVFIAVVTGVVLPVLAYLADALDGSRRSRERDDLVVECDTDLLSHTDAKERARAALASGAEQRGVVNDDLLPALRDRVKTVVDEVYFPYNAARMLIGGLTGEPATPVDVTIERDAHGNVVGWITTSLPGSGRVDLTPLFSRCARLAALEEDRRELQARLDALPHHPWSDAQLR